MSRQALEWFPLWRLLGWAWVCLVILLSLTPSVHLPAPDVGDKVAHFGAYAFLALWFSGLTHGSQRQAYLVGLALMGLALEGLQGLTAGRQPEMLDAVANTLGVTVGGAVGVFLGARPFALIESWLMGKG